MQGLIAGTIQRLEPGAIVLAALPLRVMPPLSLTGYAVGMQVIATYQEQHGEYWLTGIHHDRRAENPITDERASRSSSPDPGAAIPAA